MLVSTLYTFLLYPSSTRVPLNWILFCLALRCESQFTSPDEHCISLEGTVCLYWELYIAKHGVHCCTTWNKVPFTYRIPHFYLLRSRSLSPCPCCMSLFYASYALWTMFQSYFWITWTGVRVPISSRPGAFFTDQSSCLRFCNCLPVRCVQHIPVLISLVWWYRCLSCPTVEDQHGRFRFSRSILIGTGLISGYWPRHLHFSGLLATCGGIYGLCQIPFSSCGFWSIGLHWRVILCMVVHVCFSYQPPVWLGFKVMDGI